MKIEKSSSVLSIHYTRSLADGVVYFLMGAPLLALGLFITGWGWSWGRQENGHYAVATVVFIELLGIGLLMGATYFLSTMFDTMTFRFDKSNDRFLISGRKSIFNHWSLSGPVSGIRDVVCEVTGDVETFNSDLYLTFTEDGAALQTRKCGTGEITEDQEITNAIKQFCTNANA